MNKTTTGLLLVAGAAVAAYFAFGQTTNSGWTPPPGSTQIPAGQTVNGVTNSSSNAIWMTATGQLISSLGQAFGSIYGAVTNGNNSNGNTSSGNASSGGGDGWEGTWG
jgi:hypothetical protein